MLKHIETIYYGMLRNAYKKDPFYANKLFSFCIFLNISALFLLINQELEKRKLSSMFDDSYSFLVGAVIAFLLTFTLNRKRAQIIQNNKDKDTTDVEFIFWAYSIFSLLFFLVVATRLR